MYIGTLTRAENYESISQEVIGIGKTEAGTKWALIRYYLDELHKGDVPQTLRDNLKKRDVDEAFKCMHAVMPMTMHFAITFAPLFHATEEFDLEPKDGDWRTEPGVVTHVEDANWYEVQSRTTQEYYTVHSSSFHSDFPGQTLVQGQRVTLVFRKRDTGFLMLKTRQL